jgi:hypothetical protein
MPTKEKKSPGRLKLTPSGRVSPKMKTGRGKKYKARAKDIGLGLLQSTGEGGIALYLYRKLNNDRYVKFKFKFEEKVLETEKVYESLKKEPFFKILERATVGSENLEVYFHDSLKTLVIRARLSIELAKKHRNPLLDRDRAASVYLMKNPQFWKSIGTFKELKIGKKKYKIDRILAGFQPGFEKNSFSYYYMSPIFPSDENTEGSIYGEASRFFNGIPVAR